MATSGDTTVRARDSGELPTRFDSLLIRWLFPTECAATIRVTDPRNLIGRNAECKIRLDMSSVSRKHAEIHRDGPIFAIRDLGSSNGTFLNGRRIAHAALASGDVLRIGESVAVVAEPRSYESAPRSAELAPGLFAGPAFSSDLEPVRTAALSSLPIVLVGEIGTGKNHLARSIHHWSKRDGPLRTIPCATLPSNVERAELIGRLPSSLNATLIIDDPAELSLAAQAKLAHYIEGITADQTDASGDQLGGVRIVTATERSLDALVAEGRIRRDLKSRLAGLVVSVPPLRSRRDEIPALLEHLLALHSGGRSPATEGQFVEALCLHGWPENVRELELLVKMLLTLHGSEPLLKRSFLPTSFDVSSPREGAETNSGERRFKRRTDHDRFHLAEALKKAQGNVSAAAMSLGFSRQRAYRLMNGKSVGDFISDPDGSLVGDEHASRK
jgi:two-component system, NtrC family, response regulator GlrR